MQFPSLQPSTRYLHAGDFFSKFLFLRATIKKHGNILLVVADEEKQKKYIALSRDREQDIIPLTSPHALEQLDQTDNTLYITHVDELFVGIDTQYIENTLCIQRGDTYSRDTLASHLHDLGYEYHEYQKPGSYSMQGDRMTIIFPENIKIIIDFFDNEVESLSRDDSISRDTISLGSLKDFSTIPGTTSLLNILEKRDVFYIFDTLEFHKNYKNVDTSSIKASCFSLLSHLETSQKDMHVKDVRCETLEELVEILRNPHLTVELYTRHTQTLQNFLKDYQFTTPLHETRSHLIRSFSYPLSQTQSYICIGDDIFSKIFIKKRIKKQLSKDIDLLLHIKHGDYIVHIDHGIGVFMGIIKKSLPLSQSNTITKEYLEIQYKNNEKLFVPITEVQRVSKYLGHEHPTLTPLGGKVWEKKMKKVHDDIAHIAQELLENFAARSLRKGAMYTCNRDEIQKFQESFGFPYTPDQEDCITDILSDMQSEKNMDRLIVGDVGFGKTEIAFNAAYIALLNRKQVCFLSPLVVLAHEHFIKAKERFSQFGYNIEILTRLQSPSDTKRIIAGIKDGSIHMVIGTHKLLSDQISYQSLGIMIVDEEHKFGVVDKEKMKRMKSHIDILSLSATPIPRSLNLALSGVRDISLLKTPPPGRKNIETSIAPMSDSVIQEAGKREFARGGQMFFVHNRISTIQAYEKKLQRLFPDKKIIITHGQLPGDTLEQRILDFKNRQYDILLSTTVIENGIDFPNVNTIFLHECQNFGISQIHQLRGRVGRSSTQGYCYLLYKEANLDEQSAQRLQTIVDYNYLGAGFELAMKDLEIRGGGDILGVRQSGQAREIGVSLFLKMLEEKIETLKQEKDEGIHTASLSTKIDLMISASIDDSYFLSESDKLNFYREIESLNTREDLHSLKESFFHNISDIPESAKNLFLLLETQIVAQTYNISSITRIGTNYQIEFFPDTSLETLKSFLSLDIDTRFQVISATKMRTAIKGFENDRIFIEYVLSLVENTI